MEGEVVEMKEPCFCENCGCELAGDPPPAATEDEALVCEGCAASLVPEIEDGDYHQYIWGETP